MDPMLPGFLNFVGTVMAVPPAALPAGSPFPPLAFNTAMSLVNQQLQAVPNFDPTQPTVYALAVYNLAGATLLAVAVDQPGQTYFADLATAYGLGSLRSGLLSSSSDGGTSQSWQVSESLGNLSLGDLQLVGSPWGRAYLALAQAAGPSVWGLS